eukprot:598739-Prorocentrum_minimum.AAC.1
MHSTPQIRSTRLLTSVFVILLGAAELASARRRPLRQASGRIRPGFRGSWSGEVGRPTGEAVAVRPAPVAAQGGAGAGGAPPHQRGALRQT